MIGIVDSTVEDSLSGMQSLLRPRQKRKYAGHTRSCMMPAEGDDKWGQRAGDLRHQLYRATALIWEVYGKALLL